MNYDDTEGSQGTLDNVLYQAEGTKSNMLVQDKVGHQLIEATTLLYQPFKSAQVLHAHSGTLLLPVADGLGEAQASAQFTDGGATLGLA